VLVSLTEARVETYFLKDGVWSLATFSGLKGKLRSLKVQIPMGEIYDGSEVPERGAE
jgi:hypothetical protein